MRPGAGVEAQAPKAGDAGDFRLLGRRQRTAGQDQVPGDDVVAAVGLDAPPPRGLVPLGCGDRGLQLDVAAQVEAVREVVEVVQDLRLRGVTLAPPPFVDERRKE
jgi:hypothetical protein